MKYLPTWEMRGYARLWSKFKTRKFTHENAVNTLKMKKEIVSIIISDLKKAGWLTAELDNNDSRKRCYHLTDANTAWNNILKEMSR